MDDKNIIELTDINKSFGENHVLRNLSMKIPKGKISYIIGRSGEGKSVTLKHILGLMKPDSGLLSIEGKAMHNANTQDWKAVRVKIGALFQYAALFDSESVFDNVAFPLKYLTSKSKTFINDRVKDVLTLVDAYGIRDKMPGSISMNEKKRVGLARALALEPKILIYDEPTTSMDAFISDLIDDLIKTMQEKIEDLTTLVVSHDIYSILKIPDKITLIHEGRAYFSDTREKFIYSQDPIIRQFITGREKAAPSTSRK